MPSFLIYDVFSVHRILSFDEQQNKQNAQFPLKTNAKISLNEISNKWNQRITFNNYLGNFTNCRLALVQVCLPCINSVDVI